MKAGIWPQVWDFRQRVSPVGPEVLQWAETATPAPESASDLERHEQ